MINEGDIAKRAEQQGKELEDIFRAQSQSQDVVRNEYSEPGTKVIQLFDVVQKRLTTIPRKYNREEETQIRQLIQGFINSSYGEEEIATVVQFIDSLNKAD
jgi:BMFP domain-containing protein YqiC